MKINLKNQYIDFYLKKENRIPMILSIMGIEAWWIIKLSGGIY